MPKLEKKKDGRTNPQKRDRVGDYMKAEILKNFRKIKEQFVELAAHVGKDEALKFGLNVITMANMGFDERYESALRM